MKVTAACLFAALFAACGGDSGGTTTVLYQHQGACDTSAAQVSYEGHNHVNEGTVLNYAANPPASGPHYPVWARYQIYESEVPRPYWVHNLEHGGIVFLYSPAAEAQVVQDLKDLYANLDNDPKCPHARALLTPDSQLNTPVAAVAWEYVLSANCVDAPVIRDFALTNRNRGREDICQHGAYQP